MKNKRRKHHRIWRKDFNPMNSFGGWSRMLHRSWMVWAYGEHLFKKTKLEKIVKDELE